MYLITKTKKLWVFALVACIILNAVSVFGAPSDINPLKDPGGFLPPTQGIATDSGGDEAPASPARTAEVEACAVQIKNQVADVLGKIRYEDQSLGEGIEGGTPPNGSGNGIPVQDGVVRGNTAAIAENTVTLVHNTFMTANNTGYAGFNSALVADNTAKLVAKEVGGGVSSILAKNLKNEGPSMDAVAFCMVNAIIKDLLEKTKNWVDEGGKDGNPIYPTNTLALKRTIRLEEAENIVREIMYSQSDTQAQEGSLEGGGTDFAATGQEQKRIVPKRVAGSVSGMITANLLLDDEYVTKNHDPDFPEEEAEFNDCLNDNSKCGKLSPSLVLLKIGPESGWAHYFNTQETLAKRTAEATDREMTSLNWSEGYQLATECPEGKERPDGSCDPRAIQVKQPYTSIRDELQSRNNIVHNRLATSDQFDSNVGTDLATQIIRIAASRQFLNTSGKNTLATVNPAVLEEFNGQSAQNNQTGSSGGSDSESTSDSSGSGSSSSNPVINLGNDSSGGSGGSSGGSGSGSSGSSGLGSGGSSSSNPIVVLILPNNSATYTMDSAFGIAWNIVNPSSSITAIELHLVDTNTLKTARIGGVAPVATSYNWSIPQNGTLGTGTNTITNIGDDSNRHYKIEVRLVNVIGGTIASDASDNAFSIVK